MKRTISVAACLVLAAISLSVVVVGLLGLIAGCTAAKDAGAAVELVGCVLAHEDEQIGQIALDCRAAIADVEKILEIHRAAEQREAAKAAAKDAGK